MALGFVIDAQKRFEENRALKTSFRNSKFQENLNDYILLNSSKKSEALEWRTSSEEEMIALKAKIHKQAKREKMKFIGSILISIVIVTTFFFFLIN